MLFCEVGPSLTPCLRGLDSVLRFWQLAFSRFLVDIHHGFSSYVFLVLLRPSDSRFLDILFPFSSA